MSICVLRKIFVLILFGKVYSFVERHNYNNGIVLCRNLSINIDNIFINESSKLGYHSLIKTPPVCNLEQILKYKDEHPNHVVVNFNVVGFGNFDQTLMDKLDYYNDDIIFERYGKLNKNIDICDEKKKQKDEYNRGCRDPDFNQIVKAFIGSVEKHGALYDVFKTITETSELTIRKNIVVCANVCLLSVYEYFSITCDKCDKELTCDNDTIAIVAPSPEKVRGHCNEDIPIIFYDMLYVENDSKEYSRIFDFQFSTTTTHWSDWTSLAQKTNELITNRRWRKIAIISDDSALSKKFTDDQVRYFTSKNILFAVRYCSEIEEFNENKNMVGKMSSTYRSFVYSFILDENSCKSLLLNTMLYFVLSQALSLYKEFKAQVIIVNVAKYNLDKLTESAQNLGMAQKDIIWIFPGHTKDNINGFRYTTFIFIQNHYLDVLKLVKNLYEQSLGNEKMFRMAIKNHKPMGEAFSRNCNTEDIPRGLFKIENTGCSLRTNDFFHPCNDMQVLYLILTILVFLILVFVVQLIFNSIKSNTIEYKPLHKQPSIWSKFSRAKPRAQGFPMRPFK